ncbi:hypothetical protein EBQ74_00815 [bacterium]|nr:hypothetical protein [bacterium]
MRLPWRHIPSFSKRTWFRIFLVLTLLDLSFWIFNIDPFLGRSYGTHLKSFSAGERLFLDIGVLILIFLLLDSDDPSKL